MHGRTRKAVEETLRICREQAVLKDYLAKKEVAEFMFYIVDKEKLMERMLKEKHSESFYL